MWGCDEKISGGSYMTNAISVKDRLKKQAVEDGRTMQDKLMTYGLERTIYRLSVSSYVERFTLKGGIFLYALRTEDIRIFMISMFWQISTILTEQNYRMQLLKLLSIGELILMILQLLRTILRRML